MGVKERREREKEATRRGILDAAQTIARADGWSAVTIRKVADAIEYSPSIVYEYFSSKEAILLALLHEGFAALTAQMRRDTSATGDPRDRLYRLAASYLAFAQQYPELYQVMHGFAGIAIDAQVRGAAAQEVCGLVETALIDWAQSAGVILQDPRVDAEIAWSLLHGIVSLTVVSRMTPDDEYVRQLVARAIDTLLAGWSAGTTAS
ncbi:MAG TPA: TetR/AcrR family transcriptional regulator [Herpetosiphonaceae bacterium]